MMSLATGRSSTVETGVPTASRKPKDIASSPDTLLPKRPPRTVKCEQRSKVSKANASFVALPALSKRLALRRSDTASATTSSLAFAATLSASPRSRGPQVPRFTEGLVAIASAAMVEPPVERNRFCEAAKVRPLDIKVCFLASFFNSDFSSSDRERNFSVKASLSPGVGRPRRPRSSRDQKTFLKPG